MNILKLKTATKFLVISSLFTSSVMAYGAPTIKEQADADRIANRKEAIARICAGAINTAEDVQIAYENCDETTLNKMYIALTEFEKETKEIQQQVADFESKNPSQLDRLASLRIRENFAVFAFYGSLVGSVAPSMTISPVRIAGAALTVAAMMLVYHNKVAKAADLIEVKIDYKNLVKLKSQLRDMQKKAAQQKQLIEWMIQLKTQQSK